MNPNIRFLGVGAAIRALGVSLLGPFFTLYLRDVLAASYINIALANVAISIAPLFIFSLGGILTDRFGRRSLFLLAIAAESATIFAVSGLMVLQSFVGVVAGLGILGIVGSAGAAPFSAYVADFSTGSDRALAFTWVRVGHNAGFAAGVFAGGAVIGFFGFVVVAILAGVVIAAGLAFLAVVLEPSPFDQSLRDKRRGTTLNPPSTARTSIRASLRVLGRDRRFLAFCLTSAIAGIAVEQWVFAFPLYAHQNLGISFPILGAGLALNGVIVVFGLSLIHI